SVLVLAAVGAFRLVDRSAAARFHEWVASIPFVERHRQLQVAAAKLAGEPARHLEVVAWIAIAYAALFTVEGIGLWRQKVWAEYLTIVATTSFIPFEVFELRRRFTSPRLAILVANAA